jgi:hypothetical protein
MEFMAILAPNQLPETAGPDSEPGSVEPPEDLSDTSMDGVDIK